MKLTLPVFNFVSASGSASGSSGTGQILQKTWRDAASIIMVHGGSDSKPKYLMMERSKGSKFLPGKLCYPGGTVSSSDSSISWKKLFKSQSNSIDIEKHSFLRPNAHIPQIYHEESNTTNNLLPKQISLRITAIRELFEECGILLCEPSANLTALQSDTTVLKDWQNRVKNEPNEFIELCSNFHVVPNLSALIDWANWLTPVSYLSAKRRFDTIFYMTLLDKIPEVFSDTHEVADTMWCTAAKYVEDDIILGKLAPPQAYEMFRLSSASCSDLKRLLDLRVKLGIERWCPFMYKAKNGEIVTFPGDELYPKNPDVYTLKDKEELDATVEQLETTTTNHHRWTHTKDSKRKFSIIISDRYGHIYH